MPKVRFGKKTAEKQKVTLKFSIDCSLPIEDNVIVLSDFKNYLTERIKVNGKTGQLGDSVSVTEDGNTINIIARVAFSKRYLKFLTKKYLKKQQLRDYLRVLATKKDSYALKYFNIQKDDDDDE